MRAIPRQFSTLSFWENKIKFNKVALIDYNIFSLNFSSYFVLYPVFCFEIYFIKFGIHFITLARARLLICDQYEISTSGLECNGKTKRRLLVTTSINEMILLLTLPAMNFSKIWRFCEAFLLEFINYKWLFMAWRHEATLYFRCFNFCKS